MIISRSIHVVENGITSVFFVLNSIPLYFYTMSSLSPRMKILGNVVPFFFSNQPEWGLFPLKIKVRILPKTILVS